jgi:gamma-glutamylcyclotransferase (GGCT)/AIG2-like uncharacterized protein YtfP
MQGARFDGAAVTASGYALHDLGEYPALVVASDGVVEGEVYTVTAEHLDVLDRYEGYPDLYDRVVVSLADGTEAVAYVMSAAGVRGHPRLESGSWRR